MKKLNNLQRIDLVGDGYLGDDYNGSFLINDGDKYFLIIASNGCGWDHVSVTVHRKNLSLIKRCPTFDEMKKIKNLFFNDDEVVYQIYPKEEDYINEHPYCLHLWKPNFSNYSIPPKEGIEDKDFKDINPINLDNCICNLKIANINNWIILRVSLMTSNNKIIKSGPTWEQSCEIKDKVFGKKIVCAQYIFETIHTNTIEIWCPVNQDLILLPPTELVGKVKKYK